MKRFDKVPRDKLGDGQLMHLMNLRTALRWAEVRKTDNGYQVSRYDLRSNVQSLITVPSLHLAASMAKRFTKEAA